MKLEYNATIKQGKLTVRNRKQFDLDLCTLKDGEYVLTLERKRSKRSGQQNRYYWFSVSLIRERFKELGTECSLEDVHAFLRSKFLYNELINEKTGEVLQIPRSTTELNKSDFGEYVDRIKIFAAESMDLYIPDANEQLTIL